MAPPPIPIDPAIDNWRPSSIPISPGLGLDNLLRTSPTVPERLTSSGRGDLDALSNSLQLPDMEQNPTEPHPMLRFWIDAGPWSSQSVGGLPHQTRFSPQYGSYNNQMTRPIPPMPYGIHSPRSDIGSRTPSKPFLDSGYGGSESWATRSTQSLDYATPNRHSHSIFREYHGHQPYPREGFQSLPPTKDGSPIVQQSSPSRRSEVTVDLTCRYPECDTVSKNQSEHK